MARTPGGPVEPSPDPRKRAEEARRLAAERRRAFEQRMAEQRAAFEARMVEERAAFETIMAQARVRMVQACLARQRKVTGMAVKRTFRSGRQAPMPPRPKRPPRREGGEPVPAIPRPKPTPLTGGAAAPLDPDRRNMGGTAPPNVKWVRSPLDAESRQAR
jgi:hypothetical protein